MSETPSFPADLIDAQLRLHIARAEHSALCRTLPWSVEPLPGWPGEEHPHTGIVTGGREDSTGYTEEQAAQEQRLWALVRELSIEVSTHPFWSTRQGEALVAARMALKQHPDAVRAAGEAA
ncbi:hypothetical protein ACGFMM_34540 [Streptomyces sp. NPDC048604]|uniref:hypothetical protein n=1 Tax=Streptomyces sp. NPDC048604 TaxID=3365578 RepID=UPI003713BB39